MRYNFQENPDNKCWFNERRKKTCGTKNVKGYSLKQ